MDAAVLRECAAARDSVAMMDASTLGKIDVQGPDAVTFLDRLYTGDFSTLKPRPLPLRPALHAPTGWCSTTA